MCFISPCAPCSLLCRCVPFFCSVSVASLCLCCFSSDCSWRFFLLSMSMSYVSCPMSAVCVCSLPSALCLRTFSSLSLHLFIVVSGFLSLLCQVITSKKTSSTTWFVERVSNSKFYRNVRDQFGLDSTCSHVFEHVPSLSLLLVPHFLSLFFLCHVSSVRVCVCMFDCSLVGVLMCFVMCSINACCCFMILCRVFGEHKQHTHPILVNTAQTQTNGHTH